MQWDAIMVDGWSEIYTESRGRRTKVWVQEPETGARWLRKTPIPRAPCEAAIEHTVLQIAAACGLPVARSRPASWTGTSHGIIVESFLTSGDNLEPGANVIRGHDPGVVLDDTPAGRSAHTPDLAIESVRARNPGLVELLLAMLLFDAWVGNGDRHSENWAIITRSDASQRLAPMYDVSSCFGFGSARQS